MSWIQTLGLGDLREGKNQVKLMCINNESHTNVRNLMERLKHSPLLAAVTYGRPVLICIVSIWALPVRGGGGGGGVRACQDGLGHFFSRLPV